MPTVGTPANSTDLFPRSSRSRSPGFTSLDQNQGVGRASLPWGLERKPFLALPLLGAVSTLWLVATPLKSLQNSLFHLHTSLPPCDFGTSLKYPPQDDPASSHPRILHLIMSAETWPRRAEKGATGSWPCRSESFWPQTVPHVLSPSLLPYWLSPKASGDHGSGVGAGCREGMAPPLHRQPGAPCSCGLPSLQAGPLPRTGHFCPRSRARPHTISGVLPVYARTECCY